MPVTSGKKSPSEFGRLPNPEGRAGRTRRAVGALGKKRYDTKKYTRNAAAATHMSGLTSLASCLKTAMTT